MDLAALAEELVSIPSISEHEARYAERLSAILGELGWRVEQDALGSLYAFDEAPPRLFFSTHIDTVPPFLPPRREGSLLYGRGACDTKGGLVAMLEAGRRLRAEGRRGIGFLFVVREETDHSGAIAAAADPRLNSLDSPRIILCEPTCNRIVSAQRGVLKVRIRCTGKAGHSAFPEAGHSAIHALVGILATLQNEAWPEDELLGELRFNIGHISGGVAANVFAPEAEAQVMFRLNRPAAEILPRIETLCADAELRIETSNDPLRYQLPDGFQTCTAAFNTDASYLAPIGPVWLVGPGDIRVAHSEQEHIDLDELARGVELYQQLGAIALDGEPA